jgi:hypothetical protein
MDVRQMTLFVQNAAWRLETKREVLCSSNSSNHEGGRMITHLEALASQRVVAVSLLPPAMDIWLEFANGCSLKVFCDQMNEVDHFPNYSLRLEKDWFTVESDFKVTWESSADD